MVPWRQAHTLLSHHPPSQPLHFHTNSLFRNTDFVKIRPVCRAILQQVKAPPTDYDFRAETLAQTLQTVSSMHPELMDLVEDGSLVVVRRPLGYVERRSDGYVEPEVVYIVGTAHMSRVSADQVTRVMNAVRPENVVVELCRSRHARLTFSQNVDNITADYKHIVYRVEEVFQRGPSFANLSGHLDDRWHHCVSRVCEELYCLRTRLAQWLSNEWEGRAGIMYDEASSSTLEDDSDGKQRISNLMSMSGDNFGSAIARSLQLGGRSALALRLLLAGMSKRISSSAGVATGEEFRAARKSAEEIGAQIVLGDRPIEITLQRAWGALRWSEKVRFGTLLLQGMSSANLDASEEALQALKTDDALSAMFAAISERFPSLLQPLIHERDMYLAWSLKRSKAVNGCKRVVGVVGKGHLRGIVHALMHDQDNLRFKDLVGASDPAIDSLKGQQFLKNLVIETAIGALIWWAWDSFHH